MREHLSSWDPYIIDCNVINELCDYWPAGHEFFPRTVRFYEIQFITGGAGKMVIDDKYYELHKGDLFFRKPGMKMKSIAGFYSYNVCFDPIRLESHQHCYHSGVPFWASDEHSMLPDSGYFDDLPPMYNTARFDELEPFFAEIIQCYAEEPQTKQPRMKAVLLNIMKIIDEELDGIPYIPLEKRKTDQYYERVVSCKHYIDQHLDHNLSLETLAAEFGSSPSFFSRIFKKTLGITPIEYINDSRLTQARELFITTKMNIEQVAAACGFDNISHFYRLFKRRFQITPALFNEGYRDKAQEIADIKPEINPAVFHIHPGDERLPPDCYPTGEVTDDKSNPDGNYPFIFEYTYHNQPKYLFPIGFKMVPRVVRFYEIGLIIGGAGKEIIDGRHFNLTRGDIFFRKPGTVVQTISGHYFYEIAFDPRFSDSRRYCYDSSLAFYLTDSSTVLPNQGFFPHFPYKYRTNRFSELEPQFAGIIQSFPKRRDELPLEIRANLLKILIMVNEELNSTRPVTFENETIKHNYEKVMNCKRLIDGHPDHKFSLSVLAEMSGLSQNFFCKIFKQIIGSSPLEYITETRIRLAKNLLSTGSLTIEEISARSGFDDVAYFYRIFKRHTNMTPNAFRQRFAVSPTK